MKRLPLATAAMAVALLVPVSGNDSALMALIEANLAWERGDYPTALTLYGKLLDSPDGERVFEPIALQTGELYQTIELTKDGTAPQFSPDGRFITYETGTPLKKITRVLRSDGSIEAIAELPGSGAAFSHDSTALAYLELSAPSAALQEAQAVLDKAATNERQQRQAAVTRLLATEVRIAVRDLSSGAQKFVDTAGIGKAAVRIGSGGTIIFAGVDAQGASQLYMAREGSPPAPLTTGDGEKALGEVNAPGTSVLYTVRARGGRGGTGRGGGAETGRGGAAQEDPPATGETPAAPQTGRGGGGGGGREGAGAFGVVVLPGGKVVNATGTSPAFSADGASLAFVSRQGNDVRLMAGPALDPSTAAVVRSGSNRVDAPALSADGSQIGFQLMPREDWEVFFVSRDGKTEQRLTREIQHDLQPQFLSKDRVLAVMGEARHRRSYLYELPSGKRTRLFHNNTIRTIAPEYAWIPDPAGTKILISAERDGDTVSPERGVYLVDLSRKVTMEQLKRRIADNLAVEQALRAKGQRVYAPIAASVKQVVDRASVERVFTYQERLFSFDSKHITRPGNKLASEYLLETYKSFGYQPEYQWFSPRNALGGQTANVVATLKGTVNPELVYVVSSHYDSVAGGPGADDDSSGTAALLETARILAAHPQPATIVFASFTGEEAGLLGSREFVRRAVANKDRIVGALNNDMVGWANDQRLDSTIRHANYGIRDIQHAAAMQFSSLITYDAYYYKSTDAAAYFEAYGDIVGGIGSYPVLANPHYHQGHDVLETINHRLVTEVAKTTAATLMLLASSPSRLTELKADRSGGGVTVSWKPSPEAGVTGYLVSYGPPEKPEARQIRVANPSATLANVEPGAVIFVKAVNAKGLEGWDWARVVVK